MLTTEQMHELGNGDMVQCNWDFSKISIDEYNSFFSTLPNILYKKVRHARFCVDFAKSLHNNPDATNEDVQVLQYSIKERKPRFSWMLAKVIIRTLPRAKLLTSLTISGIPMRRRDIHAIFGAVGKCRTLKRIIFEDVHVRTEDFEYLLSVISPYKISELSFLNCGLTSDIYQPLVRFFKKPPPSERHDWVFNTLRLDGNNLGGRDFSVIDGMLRQRTDPLGDDEIPTFTIEPRETMTMDGSSGFGKRTHSGFPRSHPEEEGYYEEEEVVVLEEEEYIIEQYEDEEDVAEAKEKRSQSGSFHERRSRSSKVRTDSESGSFHEKRSRSSKVRTDSQSGSFHEKRSRSSKVRTDSESDSYFNQKKSRSSHKKSDSDSDEFKKLSAGDSDSDEFRKKSLEGFKDDTESDSDEFKGKGSDPEILSEDTSDGVEGKLEIGDSSDSASGKAHSRVAVEMDSVLRLQDVDKIDNKSREILDEVIARVAEVESPEHDDDPWKENANLKKELQELIDAIHAIEFEDDVYVFGPNAETNCELIREVMERLDEYHRESARRH